MIPTSRRRPLAGAVVLVALVGLGGGCSSDAAPVPSTSATTTSGAPVPAAPLRVDLIRPAVAALEAKLGGPQQYFEIDATPALVNLHVANGTGAGMTETAWVYVGGALSSSAPRPAQGYTFGAAAIGFDASAVTAKVTAQLPTSTQDAFVIVGGQGGAVQYSVVTTSPAGGQLIVVVGPDGAIQSVEPADDTTGSTTPVTTAS